MFSYINPPEKLVKDAANEAKALKEAFPLEIVGCLGEPGSWLRLHLANEELSSLSPYPQSNIRSLLFPRQRAKRGKKTASETWQQLGEVAGKRSKDSEADGDATGAPADTDAFSMVRSVVCCLRRVCNW